MFDEVRKTVAEIAARLRIDDFEIQLSRTDNTGFDIEQRDLTISAQVGITSLGLRLMKKGKITYAFSTEFDKPSLSHVIEVSLANLQPTKLPGFALIPTGLSWDRGDSKIAELVEKPKAFRDLLTTMVKTAWDKGKGKFERLNGGGGVSTGESWVWTAHSPEPAYSRSTAFSASVNLDSRDFEFLVARKLPAGFSIEGLGARVARRLPVKNVNPSDLGVKGKEIDVIVHPICLQSLFKNIISEHLYASNKLTGMSKYSVNNKIASSKVTIADDATHPDLLSAAPTDHEGVPSRRSVFVKKGIFNSFLYDRETAAMDKTDSTSSGMRRPVLAEDLYEAPVRPSLRALVMEPGTVKLTDMIKGIKKGVLLKMLLGIHTADKVSGSFSNTAFMSYVIRNGKLAAATEPGAWAMKGNALELLENITAISSERFLTGSALLPWVKTKLYVG